MENKYRNYFIEVNPGAECYEQVVDIIKSLKNCRYAVILHDKDINEDNTAKLPHFHAVLVFTNARSFNAIKDTFKGGHIEVAKHIDKCVRYLVHKDDVNKFQYQPNEIITNDLSFVQINLSKIDYEELNERVIIQEVIELMKAERLTFGLTYFYLTYGNEQVKKYRQMIIDLLANRYAIETLLKTLNSDTEELPF